MRFSDVLGFGESVEESPGVFEDIVTERSYFGDVFRNTRKLQDGQKVNDDVSVQNSISIVDDGYAGEHILQIRYVRWMGSLWTVDSVEVQRPRLLLRLGSVYNGPTA